MEGFEICSDGLGWAGLILSWGCWLKPNIPDPKLPNELVMPIGCLAPVFVFAGFYDEVKKDDLVLAASPKGSADLFFSYCFGWAGPKPENMPNDETEPWLPNTLEGLLTTEEAIPGIPPNPFEFGSVFWSAGFGSVTVFVWAASGLDGFVSGSFFGYASPLPKGILVKGFVGNKFYCGFYWLFLLNGLSLGWDSKKLELISKTFEILLLDETDLRGSSDIRESRRLEPLLTPDDEILAYSFGFSGCGFSLPK